jgi:hypothetical protein
MNTYVILRRDGWETPDDLQRAGARSAQVGDQMPDEVRWLRSYAIDEADGGVGTVCVYQASSPEAIRRHAGASGLPVTEIIHVADTIVVRPDPVPVGA